MNPILSALIASPAVVDVSRRAINELLPVIERSLKGSRAGKLLGAGPLLLTSCFAAGVVAGWLTAPAKGSELRAQMKDRVRSWAKSAGEQVQTGRKFLSTQLARTGFGSAASAEQHPDVGATNGGTQPHPEGAPPH